MDLELFKNICIQLPRKTRRVCLHLLGDPLSVADIESYICVVRDCGLKVDLVSTGLYLRERDFEVLSKSPIAQVSFSLSAMLANPARVRSIHLQNILAFCDYVATKQSDIFVNLRLQDTDIAVDSQYFHEILGVISRHFNLCHHALYADLSQNKKVRLEKKILLLPTRTFEWQKAKTNDASIGRFCPATQKHIGILSDGSLVPCCMDYEGRASFGNLRFDTLKTLLDSQSFIAFDESLERGACASDICKHCGFHDR